MSSEVLISDSDQAPIAMGMTVAAFDGAQRSGITHIGADIEAMTFLARKVGFVSETAMISPLVIMARDGREGSRWDDRLPEHAGMRDSGRFFYANHLGHEPPDLGNSEYFAGIARRIGAPALTELTIDWDNEERHAGVFVTALLFGQRPLVLPPAPSNLPRAAKFLQPQGAQLALTNRVRANANMPKPFVITR